LDENDIEEKEKAHRSLLEWKYGSYRGTRNYKGYKK